MSTTAQEIDTAGVSGGDGSVYRPLAARSSVTSHRLRKSTLLALSWAIEDQFCARAQSPVLFGAFQRERYWRASRRRWEHLGALAQHAMVFADFAASTPGDVPVRVALPVGHPLLREWVLVCDSAELPVVLAAWEIPGQGVVPEPQRLFDAVWTMDPEAVRQAARRCAHIAADCGLEDAQPVQYALADDPRPATISPAEASELFSRMIAYLDRFGMGSDGDVDG